jgi:O-antigen/teichoic acid export membrane protein
MHFLTIIITTLFSSVVVLLFMSKSLQIMSLEGLGFYGYMLSITACISFLDYGITQNHARYLANSKVKQQFNLSLTNSRKSVISLIMISFFIAITVNAVSIFILDFISGIPVEIRSYSHLALVITIFFVARVWQNFYKMTLYAINKSAVAELISGMSVLLRWFGGFLFIKNSVTPDRDFVIWLAITEATVAMAYLFSCTTKFNQLKNEHIGPESKFLNGIGGLTLLQLNKIFKTQADKLVVGQKLGMSDMGSYTAANALVSSLTAAVTPFVNYFYHSLIRVGEEKKESLDKIKICLILIALALNPLYTLVDAYGDYLLAVWLSNYDLGKTVGSIMPSMIVILICQLLNHIFSLLYMAEGREKICTYSGFFSTLIFLIVVNMPVFSNDLKSVVTILLISSAINLIIVLMNLRESIKMDVIKQLIVSFLIFGLGAAELINWAILIILSDVNILQLLIITYISSLLVNVLSIRQKNYRKYFNILMRKENT